MSFIAAAIGAAGVLGGAVISSRSQSSAASQQADAARYAADKADPFAARRGQYADIMAQFYAPGESDREVAMRTNPAYQFSMNEGIRALTRNASAKGMLKSGNYMQDLLKYSQGLASQNYTAEMNRLMTLSGATVGSPAAAGQAYQSGMNNAIGSNLNAHGQLGYGLTQAGGMLAKNIQSSNLPTAISYGTRPGSQQTSMLAEQWAM